MRHWFPAFGGCIVLLIATGSLGADEHLKGIACRSVHLHYSAGAGTAFYDEVTVDQSAPGTYFCACGWNKGYFGIQELGNGKKVVIFSVWDSNQNDPRAVAGNKRVQVLHKDEKVRIGRFGGEGTGGQSFFDYDWKRKVAYRFLVTAQTTGERSEYAGFFYIPEEKRWKHLVTFSTISGGKALGGYYSFVEDFKRDRVSTTKVRRANFANVWVKNLKSNWEAATEAKFTADANPVVNINAGVKDDQFFLATGGETKNTDVQLGKSMRLTAETKRSAPEGLPTPTRGAGQQ